MSANHRLPCIDAILEVDYWAWFYLRSLQMAVFTTVAATPFLWLAPGVSGYVAIGIACSLIFGVCYWQRIGTITSIFRDGQPEPARIRKITLPRHKAGPIEITAICLSSDKQVSATICPDCDWKRIEKDHKVSVLRVPHFRQVLIADLFAILRDEVVGAELKACRPRILASIFHLQPLYRHRE